MIEANNKETIGPQKDEEPPLRRRKNPGEVTLG